MRGDTFTVAGVEYVVRFDGTYSKDMNGASRGEDELIGGFNVDDDGQPLAEKRIVPYLKADGANDSVKAGGLLFKGIAKTNLQSVFRGPKRKCS